jgi:hypothetical protein
VVYVAPDALRNLIAAKLRRPHLLFVSANVVNHPLLAHVHQRVGLLDADDVESMRTAPNESSDEMALLPDSWSFGYMTFSGDGWCAAPAAAFWSEDFDAFRPRVQAKWRARLAAAPAVAAPAAHAGRGGHQRFVRRVQNVGF